MRLEPLGPKHVETVEALLDDPGVQRFTRVPVPPPAGFARTFVRLYEEGRRDGTRDGFAVVDGGDEVLAFAMAVRIEREARSAELGYVVLPAARGRGVATESLRLLTDWAFAELGCLRLELLISVENDASKRVAERCGYVREGVLRSLHLKQDVRTDTEIWSRLPSDP
jgi:RimJ/RimL family protein N-acetyltransferase